MYIKIKFKSYINESSYNKYTNYVDEIVDRINKNGRSSLTPEEKTFLAQYNSDSSDEKLYNWLIDDDRTVDNSGNKLMYDEFDFDENIYQNEDKLIRVINKLTSKKPFTNNADWNNGYVWNIDSTDNMNGYFLYLNDDELVFLKRITIDDETQDEIVYTASNGKELYQMFNKIRNKEYSE